MTTSLRAPATLVALVLIALPACGGDDDDDATSQTTTSGPTTTEPTETTVPATETVSVYFVNEARFNEGTEPYVDPVERDVDAADPMQGAVDALFAGPTADETGLIFEASGATAADVVGVVDGVVSVQLVGDCSSGGSTLTIATELVPTLKEFDEVTAVKILDAEGETEKPEGAEDSIPTCLEP